VHSFDGDWLRALETLAAVDPDGPTPVASLLADEAGPASRALELTVVTASLTPRLAERLAQRVFQRHAATLVYVDPASFAAETNEMDAGVAGQILRLERAGVPVAVVRRGDDLVSVLGGARIVDGAAVG
jgi:predicted Abi (CAAX) family protease